MNDMTMQIVAGRNLAPRTSLSDLEAITSIEENHEIAGGAKYEIEMDYLKPGTDLVIRDGRGKEVTTFPDDDRDGDAGGIFDAGSKSIADWEVGLTSSDGSVHWLDLKQHVTRL